MTEQPVDPAGTPNNDDLFAFLDFTPECDMIHDNVKCHEVATHLVTIHDCNSEAGIRVPVCAAFMTRLVEMNDYPYRCERCKKPLSSLLDRGWDIEQLGGTS